MSPGWAVVAVLVLMLASRDRVRDRGMSTISPACNNTNSVNNTHNNNNHHSNAAGTEMYTVTSCRERFLTF